MENEPTNKPMLRGLVVTAVSVLERREGRARQGIAGTGPNSSVSRRQLNVNRDSVAAARSRRPSQSAVICACHVPAAQAEGAI